MTPSLYEKVLGRIAASEPAQSRPPRASAAIVPWRSSASGLQVFWVRRAEELKFMGGWYAFPGGGLQRTDRDLSVIPPPGLDSLSDDHGLPEALVDGLEIEELTPPGLLVAALRELFEELGILLISGNGDESEGDRAEMDSLRASLVEGTLEFGQLVARTGGRLDASRLVFAGRWLTPQLGPMRFDNRFFLLELVAGDPEPAIVPGEIASGEWITPSEALRKWDLGEVMLAPPIVHILRILAEDGPYTGRERLQRPDEAVLGPFRRVEFRPGVLLFPLATPTLPPATHTNCYLLGAQKRVLIDPGSPFPRETGRLLSALEVVREKDSVAVGAIWLTHHHPDHVGGVNEVRRALGVPVLAHPHTAERLEGLGIGVDDTLLDDEVVELGTGFPVRVLHTPGHAPGHLCFFDEQGGSLVCGDMVSGLSTIVIDPPEGDMATFLASLTRLAELSPRVLFPAHGPVLKDGAGHLARTVEHRIWREGRVLEAWRDGIREPADIVPVVYEELDPVAHPLAERQVRAHLKKLRAEGRISSER